MVVPSNKMTRFLKQNHGFHKYLVLGYLPKSTYPALCLTSYKYIRVSIKREPIYKSMFSD